jgi:hypothetical protein
MVALLCLSNCFLQIHMFVRLSLSPLYRSLQHRFFISVRLNSIPSPVCKRRPSRRLKGVPASLPRRVHSHLPRPLEAETDRWNLYGRCASMCPLQLMVRYAHFTIFE